MKILIASHPWDGHFNPMTSVAMHLRACGHDVHWYTGKSYAPRIAKLGIPHHPFQRAREINADNLSEYFPEYDTKAMSPKMMELGVREMFFAPIEPNYRDIAEIHATVFAFDAFVCDAALFCSRIVAEKVQPRTYVVSAAPTPAPMSRTAPAPFFGFHPARTPIGRVRDRVVHAMLERTARSGMALFQDLRRREGLAPYEGNTFDIHVDKSRAIFQTGVAALEFPRDDWPANFEFIGALLPYRAPERSADEHARALPASLATKLTRYASVLAVSQGTTDNRDPGKLFLPALEAFAGTDRLIVVTTGGRHTAELRARFPQENVVIEDWIDFHALLPRTSTFICNGGMGSVLLSLSYGVPVLAAGKLEGKADINARLAYRGVGVDLRTERPSAKQIARGVARIERDPHLMRRVRDMQAELARHRPLELIEQRLTADMNGARSGSHSSARSMPSTSIST
jgi:UDP:flavonoid glycosyltransferase YjiC (YdhE family)